MSGFELWLFGLIFIINHVLFLMAGVFVIDRTGLGVGYIVFQAGSAFRRSLISSLVVLAVPMLIAGFSHALRPALIIYFLSAFFIYRLAFLHISPPEILVLVFSAVAGMLLFGAASAAKFTLYMYEILVLFVLFVLLNAMWKQKKHIRIRQEFEQRRTREYRHRVRTEPGFRTDCYTCAHFDPSDGSCQRTNRGLEVKEIHVGAKGKFCLDWKTKSLEKDLKRN